MSTPHLSERGIELFCSCHRKKYQKSNLFFTWFFPGFINIHVQMKAKFGLNLDFSWIILFSIENQWFFLLWILKNRLQPGFLENQEAALCFIYYPGLVLSVWITKYPDWQTPNLDNLLAKTGFFLNPNLDKSKNNSGI